MRASLEGRRHVIANVLAALQRIGRNPPPALLVTPEDALQSVRSAMLLGAVLPDMRQDVEALIADLSALASVRKEIAAERAGLEKAAQRWRTTRRSSRRSPSNGRSSRRRSKRRLPPSAQRAAQLARQADDVLGLIVKLEQDLDSATRAARVAARSGEDTQGERCPPGLCRPQGSRPARPRDPLRPGQGNITAAGEWCENQGIRGFRRARRP